MDRTEKQIPLPIAFMIIFVGGVAIIGSVTWIFGSQNDKLSIEQSREETSSQYSNSAVTLGPSELVNTRKTTARIEHPHSERLHSHVVADASDLFYVPSRKPPYKASEISFHETRESAINALAVQFDKTPYWVEANIGSTNDLTQIHNNLVNALMSRTSGVVPLPIQSSKPTEVFNTRTGTVDYGLVSTLRQSWRRDSLQSKPKALQAQAMALIIMVVNTDVENSADRKATLDYIEANIGSW